MAEHPVDLATWPRAAQFQLFRGFQTPHFSVTSRLDVTRLMTLKPQGQPIYRSCLFALANGLHAAPELRMRFQGDQVVIHDSLSLSMTVPRKDGSFGFGYVPYVPDFAEFDVLARDEITRAANETELQPKHDTSAVAYLSCLPWMDFTAMTNAMPGPDDCIPRVSWGRIMKRADGTYDMAAGIEVHHALVDGVHVGQFFAAAQEALNQL